MGVKVSLAIILFSICTLRGDMEKLTVQSFAFSPNGLIQKKYTCDGANISPGISWGKGPAETKSYVLICDDPDAPGGTWVHWIVYDIPASVNVLLEGQTAEQIGAKPGVNSWGKKYYSGPCPPSGIHRYYFKVYAADVPALNIVGEPTKRAIIQALNNHTLAQGEVMGRYERKN